MKCPFFEGKHINYCNLYSSILIPEIEEIKIYCTSTEYNTCPELDSYSKRISLEQDNNDKI